MEKGKKSGKKAEGTPKCGLFSCFFPWKKRREVLFQSSVDHKAENNNRQKIAEPCTEDMLNDSCKPTIEPGSFKPLKFVREDVSSGGCLRKENRGIPQVLEYPENFDVINISVSSLPNLNETSTNWIGSFKPLKFVREDVSSGGCLRKEHRGIPQVLEYPENFDVINIAFSSLPNLHDRSTYKTDSCHRLDSEEGELRRRETCTLSKTLRMSTSNLADNSFFREIIENSISFFPFPIDGILFDHCHSENKIYNNLDTIEEEDEPQSDESSEEFITIGCDEHSFLNTYYETRKCAFKEKTLFSRVRQSLTNLFWCEKSYVIK